jgi:hypothetical protein
VSKDNFLATKVSFVGKVTTQRRYEERGHIMENEASLSTDESVVEPNDHNDLGHRAGGVDAVGGRDVEPFDVVGGEDQSDDDDAVGGVDVRYLESIGGVDVDDDNVDDADSDGEEMKGEQI